MLLQKTETLPRTLQECLHCNPDHRIELCDLCMENLTQSDINELLNNWVYSQGRGN